MKLYMDNAATTYPKPQKVYDSVMNYMTNIGANPGRGGYSNALNADSIVYNCRNTIAEFFNSDKAENVIFTANITHSLNILIKGAIKNNWHVITTSMEHNSVLRPLFGLKKYINFELDIIDCDKNGFLHIDDLKKKIKSTTKLIILSHASNIIGSIQPIEEIGNICKQYDIYLIVDSAQSAGIIPIDFNDCNISALAFTGHKSLLGPQGIGGFIITDEFNSKVSSLIEGGTGSVSNSTYQPEFMPDKFESGTMNTPGIAGLLEGINYIKTVGLEAIKQKEELLCKRLIEKLQNIDGITVYGTDDCSMRTAAISITSSTIDTSELAYILDSEFGIMARSGLHCAPLAHKTIGTYPSGTLRFSPGPFNNKDDIDYVINSLYKIQQRK